MNASRCGWLDDTLSKKVENSSINVVLSTEDS